MSETRFTPGPWRAVVRANQHGPQMVAVDMPPRGAWRPSRKVLADVDVANARLMAAAPTLYDTAAETVPALRRLIAEMNLGPDGEGRDWLDMLTACADDLDAAMAKARGEA